MLFRYGRGHRRPPKGERRAKGRLMAQVCVARAASESSATPDLAAVWSPRSPTALLLSEPQRQCLEVFVPADAFRSLRYSFGVSPVQRMKACRKLTASLNPSVNATSSVLSRVVVK